MRPSLWIVALACLVASGCSSPPGLVGAWRSKVQFEDGAFAQTKDLEFLYVFNAGGTMTESSNYDGAPPVPPAYGVWQRLGPSQFEARYVFYTSRPPASFDEVAKGGGWMPAGRGDLTERITLAEDGQSYQSDVALNLYDQNGKPADGGGKATGRAERIK